jgi:hypothetical protein
MAVLALADMQGYLSRSLSSVNQNKLNGLNAEIDFRRYVGSLGYAPNVSPGGWISRSVRVNGFGSSTLAIFPETIIPGTPYPASRIFPAPQHRLGAVANALHAIGIKPYYCCPVVNVAGDATSVSWSARDLSPTSVGTFNAFPGCINGFAPRVARYKFLRYKSNSAIIPGYAVPDEFSKENLRVIFQTAFFNELSDIDGIIWGKSKVYPIELKEKTSANDPNLGDWFGIDIGPFTKLAYYAAKKGNLDSLFIVREIVDVKTRELKRWWYIRFEELASYASWVHRSGGRGMGGGLSAVVRVPKSQFHVLDAAAFATF